MAEDDCSVRQWLGWSSVSPFFNASENQILNALLVQDVRFVVVGGAAVQQKVFVLDPFERVTGPAVDFRAGFKR